MQRDRTSWTKEGTLLDEFDTVNTSTQPEQPKPLPYNYYLDRRHPCISHDPAGAPGTVASRPPMRNPDGSEARCARKPGGRNARTRKVEARPRRAIKVAYI